LQTELNRRKPLSGDKNMKRFAFLSMLGAFCLAGCESTQPVSQTPNIILCMADDLGWGDVASNGHPVIKTPALDEMSKNGINFRRFYSGAPLCSPTRGSSLTGRHPYRYGIYSANIGHLPEQEITLAELLRDEGYSTGHFGKWHLGTLTTELEESNRGGPRGREHYSPPWLNGFDVCFSTEAKVPTWDPMVMPSNDIRGVDLAKAGQPYGTHYWTGPGERVSENLNGDDSRVIMDRVIPFIREAAQKHVPFFAVVWFHTPHSPVVAGPEYLTEYEDLSEEKQHYYGCITAMDREIGRLRTTLRELGIARDTMLWFCSDNGPEGDGQSGRCLGSTGPFRGRKRSLLEGGVRVPALLEWPAVIESPRVVETPCSTSDYFPTVLEILGGKPTEHPHELDGISLLPLIKNGTKVRSKPIAFQSAKQLSLVGNRYKLYSGDEANSFLLYDLIEDPGETTDLASSKPEIVSEMKRQLEQWRESCRRSLRGEDYADR
jgi:arylsulfatase A-like enzyme